MNFKDGKKFGPYKEYYPNGQLYIWANYADGEFLMVYTKSMTNLEML